MIDTNQKDTVCNSNNNPITVTLGVMGGKWKPIILWHLEKGPHRFNQLLKNIPGVTQKMLTQQLRELESDGLVNRKIYPQIPPKVEYSITKYGISLEPVLKVMAQWGSKHKDRIKN
ncbi:MAG: helix-turn-helix transcriptional regulator [Candidatus Levybacteria bacterium]|nr:helix-turn-helix transcriptional regulator [Candidatus Levybacteria bacterium]